VHCLRPLSHGHLGDHDSVLHDSLVESGILGRVDVIDPARQHGHGAHGERALMRGGINPAGKSGDDDHPSFAEIAGELAPKLSS
jgi:hypothetical protein